jgi:hypothetical protein
MENLGDGPKLKRERLECALRGTISVPKASRFLGAGAVDQHNVIARQQQRLPAIAWRGQAVLCNLIIFRMLGCGSPLAASGLLSKQYAEGSIPCVLDSRIASSRTFRRCKFELLG